MAKLNDRNVSCEIQLGLQMPAWPSVPLQYELVYRHVYGHPYGHVYRHVYRHVFYARRTRHMSAGHVTILHARTHARTHAS